MREDRGGRDRAAWAVAACVVLAGLLIAAFAAGHGGPPPPTSGVKLRTASQQEILRHDGLTVRVDAPGAVRVRTQSSTFDRPRFQRLTKTTRARTHGDPIKAFLALTNSGRKAIRSCEARTLRVVAGGARETAQLVRDTAACRPRPIDLTNADRCEFIGEQRGSLCLLPFPNDHYTVADPTTATGRRVDLQTESLPANASGTHIDATPYNLSDGFSPGPAIVLRVPGLTSEAALEETGAVPINHIGEYARPSQPVVLIDADTGERWPIWAEIDSNATEPGEVALLIHPATNLAAGHRYIVALRHLRTAAAKLIPAPEGFRYYRDDLPSGRAAINSRRVHFERIFETLRDAGIERRSLYLAWDFTVASDENIAARALHMRDDAFAELGDTDLADLTVEGTAPDFAISQVTEFTAEQNPRVARRIIGTYEVPCYLQPSCAPGGRFALDANGLPTRNGTWTANFDCIVPRVAVDQPGATPQRPSLYGHGLFGTASQVASGTQPQLANDHGFVLCATDEIGMSSSDVGNTIGILADLSAFPELADRLQQGLLNELFLGRLMIHPDGFLIDPAFHVDPEDVESPPVIDDQELYYDGNSQGGIMGGALTAIAPDFTRATLGVPAMRYSMLLPRSIDYDPFAAILNPTYPDELSRPLILSLIQMLWDRGEPNGYAHRMTDDPLPNTPAHEVLMMVAFGDHQVTNFAADIEARTIGAATHAPVLDPGRWPGVDVLWNVPRIESYPYDGSGVVYGDIGPVRPNPANPAQTIGVPPPPLENLPNREGEDPHGAPRGAASALQLKSDFLAPDGAVTNACGDSPCYAGGWTGPG